MSPDDPFSWIFQANIHGRPFFPDYVYDQAGKSDDPALRLFRDKSGFAPDPMLPDMDLPVTFSQCPHGNWWFLPWHRAYLYYFERILRWASGNPDLALPYWNYSDEAQRTLPRTFRAPKVGDDPNPLYLPASARFTDKDGKPQLFPMRDQNLNTGLGQLTAGVVGLSALQVPAFASSAPAPTTAGFGSPRACDKGCTCGSGALENVPHNTIHNAIGGPLVTTGGGFWVGFMGDITTAARDPLFWMHHGNIDRLWDSWVGSNGHATPDDAEWLDYTFAFYDVGDDGKPKAVKIKTSDVLNTKKLGYTYDKLEEPPKAVTARAVGVRVTGETTRSLAATTAAVQLDTTTRKSVSVPLGKAVRSAQILKTAGVKPSERPVFVLSLEGITFEHAPGVFYDVYLSPPDDEELTHKSRHYVDTLTFFGLKGHAGHGHGGSGASRTVKFAVPPTILELIKTEKLNPEMLTVTFVPQTGVESVKKGDNPKAPKKAHGAGVKIARVRLLTVS